MKSPKKFGLFIATLICVAVSTNVGFAQVNVALGKSVSLNGDPFFTGGWGGGWTVSPDTVVDGIFLPRGNRWDQDPVWWDSHDNLDRWIEIDLEGTFVVKSLIVQADDNDAYKLYYWNMSSSSWQPAWDVPNYDAYGSGMQTRPNPDDDTERYDLPSPITTNLLKFEGNMGDGDKYFSVSEIQAFGKQLVEIDIKPETLNLKSRGVFTVFMNLPEGYDKDDVDISTVQCQGAPAVDMKMADDNKLILKFNREDLVGVSPGDPVLFTVEGMFTDGTPFIGTDTAKVKG